MADISKENSSQVVLFVLCTLAYMCAYLSRDTFSATIPNIIAVTGATKTQLGTISTVFLIFYGLGQIFSGFLGDKFRADRLIVFGLLIAAICNYLFSATSSLVLMTIFWGCNGIGLSLLWAPIAKLFSIYLDAEHRTKYIINISLSMPAGTLLAFFMSAYFIREYTYKTVFIVVSIIIFAVFTLFLLIFSKIKSNLPTCEIHKVSTSQRSNISLFALFSMSGMIFTIFAVMFNGIIRNGVSIWVPTYLTEEFKLEEFISILTSTIIPIVNIGGIYLGSFLVKKTRNEAISTTILFCFTFVLLFLLSVVGDVSPFIAILFLSLLSAAMQGANAIIMSLMPMYFRKYNKVSTVTGCLNANSYLAASIGSFAAGILSTSFGWGATIYFWLVMSALGIITTILYAQKWKTFTRISQDYNK